jgi:CRP-like cAMP-binding protein
MESKGAHLCFELPEELLGYGRARSYPRNSVIFWQDEPAEEVFYLKEGEVRLAFYGTD